MEWEWYSIFLSLYKKSDMLKIFAFPRTDMQKNVSIKTDDYKHLLVYDRSFIGTYQPV